MRKWISTLPGEFLILMAATLFAVSNTLMRLAVETLPAWQVLWLRFSLAGLVLGFIGWRGGLSLRVERPWILVFRGITVSLGALCSFQAVALTSFANFSVLVYTNPIFGTLISRWYFGEKFKPRDLAVLVLTFSGVVLIMRPGWHGVQFGDALALISGMWFGLALAIVKEAAKTETVGMITLSFYSVVSIFSASTALAIWHPMTGWAWALVLGLMVIGTSAQLLETGGYRRCSVAVGGALSYWTVVVSIGLGAWLFREPLHPLFFAGAALIIGCGVYVVTRKD